MTVPELNSKIQRQVEFYFSDANLPRDKFLLQKTRENEQGWVPVELVASFQRMKSLCQDMQVVIAALAGPSELVELNDDQTMVRRKTALPEHIDTLHSSIYAKGFPVSTSLDQIHEFFSKHSDHVKAIRMRRNPKTKEFKGSVFVEFGSAEEANRVAALGLCFCDLPLVLHTKTRYFEIKNDERTGKKPAQNNFAKDFAKGSLAVITGVPDNVTHQAIKSAIGETFPVAFAAFENGAVWLRFKEPVAAAFIEHYSQPGLTIGESSITDIRIATEIEEKDYYANLSRVMSTKQSKQSKGKRDSYKNKRQAGKEIEQSAKKAKADDQASQ